MLARFLSRKFILAVLAGIAGIAVAAYPEQSDSIQRLTELIGGLAVTLLVTLGYIHTEGKVDAAKAANPLPVDPPAPATSPPGAVSSPAIIGLLMLGLVLGATGCQSTPTKRWAMAAESFNSAQQAFQQAAEARLLTDEQIVLAGHAIEAADAALRVAKAQLPEGSKSFDDYLAIVSAVAEQLVKIFQEAHAGQKVSVDHVRGDYGWGGAGADRHRVDQPALGDRGGAGRPDSRADPGDFQSARSHDGQVAGTGGRGRGADRRAA